MLEVILVAFSVGVLTMLLIVFIWRWCCFRQRKDNFVDTNQTRPENLQTGIACLHDNHLGLDSKRRGGGNYYVFRRGVSAKPSLFNWADHPELVTDVVENGWSRFGFTSYMPSPSTRSSLLGICSVCDCGRETPADMSWEVCQGSADFMQKIRLNSGLLKKVNNNTSSPSSMAAASVIIRTALPLPGPPLGNSAFPQEAYFEITILYVREDDDRLVKRAREGEKTKLIQENSNANANSESLVHVMSSTQRINKIEELKLAGSKDDGRADAVMLSLGLAPAGSSLPLKLPGSYPGSIGFNSDGSVYLDGIKLVSESEKAEWGRSEKVIGCGFDPRQKKVFFTVDSELVHVISCKSEEFETPLYPTIAADIDVLLLVNFGQSVFTYAPANAKRTSNPCFIGPRVNNPAAAIGYEDSKELFSMGRIDSEWLNQSSTKGGPNVGANNNNNRKYEFDEESEADLFEIVLESSEQSPNTVL